MRIEKRGKKKRLEKYLNEITNVKKQRESSAEKLNNCYYKRKQSDKGKPRVIWGRKGKGLQIFSCKIRKI